MYFITEKEQQKLVHRLRTELAYVPRSIIQV